VDVEAVEIAAVTAAVLLVSLAATIYLFAVYFSDEPDPVTGKRSWFLWTLATLALMKLLIGAYFAFVFYSRLVNDGDAPDWTRPVTYVAIIVLLLSSVFYAVQIERRRRLARARRLKLKEALIHDDPTPREDPEPR
jgi:hypothetical protein